MDSKKLKGIKKPFKKQLKQKRLERRQNQSLRKLYQQIRHDNSIDDDVLSAMAKARANTDFSRDVIELEEDTSLFFEDRTGNDGIEASVRTSFPIIENSVNRNKRKSMATEPQPKVARKNSTIVLSDEDDLVTSVITCDSPVTSTPTKQVPKTVISSTPNQNERDILHISNLSSVQRASPTNYQSGSKSLDRHIENLTKEINSKDFVTIDLTSGTSFKTCDNSVIDLSDAKEDGANSPSASSRTSFSRSCDSVVTVVSMDEWRRKRNGGERSKMKKIAEGIAQMNSSEKGRLLEIITSTILSGCKEPTKEKMGSSKAPESLEDTYIKQVILGRSQNYLRTNIYNPKKDPRNRSGLRMIVIDGSNVAMHHGNHTTFSVKGLQICIEYFLRRGHTVKAFVPHFRCKFGMSSDPGLLMFLERRGLVVFTPSMEVQGRTVTSYDDRFIVQCAAEFEGVIVSRDRYRDLVHEDPTWRLAIETRHLQFTWVNDMIMFAMDPLGRDGPTLEQFLRHGPTRTGIVGPGIVRS